MAADLSMFYVNDKANWGKKDGTFSWGLNLSNLGAKMSYTETAQARLHPNLRIGAAYETIVDEYNSFTVALDANKLLVPTQPLYALDDPSVIINGMDPNVGVANGIIESFTMRRASSRSTVKVRATVVREVA